MVNEQERKSAWTRIQREAPDTAAFLQDMAREFGKPEAALVKICGEIVTDTRREK